MCVKDGVGQSVLQEDLKKGSGYYCAAICARWPRALIRNKISNKNRNRSMHQRQFGGLFFLGGGGM